MKMNRSMVTGVLAGLTVLCVTAGGICAYFTDTEEKVNKFTVGNIDITLEEPEWEKLPDEDGDGIPDEAENLTPNASVKKDPQVKNTGSNDAYLFLTVEVPTRSLITVNDDGTKNAEAMTQLFSYTADSSWKLLGSAKVTGEDGTQTGVKYLYAYASEDGTATVVKPEETTSPLFEQVQLVNVMEGQGIENGGYSIRIDAYGIQTGNLNGGTTDAEEIWKVITNQKELSDTYAS